MAEDTYDEEYETAMEALDEEPEEGERPFEYDENAPSLCEAFHAHEEGLEALKRIKRQVIDDFDHDWASTEEYRRRMADDWKLFSGDIPPKDWPFKNCANVNVPIMLENITRLAFRTEGEIFGDWSNVHGVAAMTEEAREAAEVVNMHGNWQLQEDIPDFKRQMSRLCLMFYGPGDVTVHSFHDAVRKQNCHEVLTPNEFVIPYTHQAMMPDYSDVPRRTKIIMKYKHELEQLRGTYYDVDAVFERPPLGFDDDPEQEVGNAMAETNDQDFPEDDTAKPYKLLWQETWLSLPNQDRMRFCQVIIDYNTRHILHLSIHEEEDWRDRIRYEEQVREATQYQAAYDAYQQSEMQATAMEEAGMEAMANDPNMEAQGAMMVAEAKQYRMPPPVAPAWAGTNEPGELPAPPRKVPINLFTHIVCVEPPAGNLGIGYGRIQGDYARAGNTMTNQFIDSGTMHNIKGWLAPEEADPKVAQLELAPGRMHRIEGLSAQEMAGIQRFETSPPSPALKEAIDMVMGWSQSSIQAPDVLSGEPGKSGETAKGILARIEQATKQLTVSARHLADGVTQIIKNNAKLNAIHLPDEQIVHVTDSMGQPRRITVSRQLYQRNYRYSLRADLRFTTKVQKVQEADEVVGMVMTNPMLASNPSLVYAVVRRAFEARGLHDLVQLLPDPMQIQMQQQMAMQQQGGPPGQPPS